MLMYKCIRKVYVKMNKNISIVMFQIKYYNIH